MSVRKITTLDNPYVLMSILLVLWWSFATTSKFALRTLDSFQVQFLMFGVSAIVLTVPFLWRGGVKRLRALSSRQIAIQIVCALLSYGYYLFYILALDTIPAMEASMLNYLFPIFIVVLSLIVDREKMTLFTAFVLLLGFSGMVMIVSNGNFTAIRLTDLTGDLLAILAAVCWAVFSVCGRAASVDLDISIYIYTVISFIVATASLFLFSAWTVPDISGFSFSAWLGLSSIVFTYYLWFRGLRSSSSSLVAILSFFTPFVTALFIVVLLDEKLTLWQCMGGLVILAGTLSHVFAASKGRSIAQNHGGGQKMRG